MAAPSASLPTRVRKPSSKGNGGLPSRRSCLLRQSALAPWTDSNITTGQSFSTTVPYSSTYATAEWVEETPVVIDNGGHASVGPMPNLSTVKFDSGLANNTNPNLISSEAIQLVDFNAQVLATPSSPDSDADGFNDCTYATSCASFAS